MKSSLPTLALALGMAGAAQAFIIDDQGLAGRPIKWNLLPPFDTDNISTNLVNPVTRAVRYYLASDAWSTTNRVNELNALRASFAQWQAIPGTLLKFEDGGTVAPGVDINTFDTTNVVFFAHSSFVNGGRDNLSGAAGRTYISWFTDNNDLAEADIVLNGLESSWFTDMFGPYTLAKFVEAVTLHEIGHMAGFFHTPVGAGTMYHSGDQGLANLQTGLSPDEFAAARALYPATGVAATFGHLRGRVTLGGVPVIGAAVYADDSHGNMMSATVTRSDGFYDLSYLPAGEYQVRVAPLDPNTSPHYLTRGREISPYFTTNALQTGFLPTANQPVTLQNGVTNALNFAVSAGTSPFRVGHLRLPTTNAAHFALNRSPVSVSPGQSNLWVGVLSPTLPTSGATLSLSGDGVTLGSPIFNNTTFPGTNVISAMLSVSSNATPGLRSFVVTRQSDGATAWANGFLEILPRTPDFNFDGLDDLYQRRWFPLFTATEAGPAADPDGDTYTNLQEYQGGGTNPKSASAFPLVTLDRVTFSESGNTVVWQSVPGKRYQLQSRANFSGASWQNVGAALTATALTTSGMDAGVSAAMRFYRVQVLP
jgi:hypothetical protein